MCSAKQIERAKEVADKHCDVIYVRSIGSRLQHHQLFQNVVPSVGYRIQVLYHALVGNVKHVVCIVAKGGHAARGGIIYVAILEVSSALYNSYAFNLNCLYTSSLTCIGKSANEIPPIYDGAIKTTSALVFNSLCLYYNLIIALKRFVQTRSKPLPHSRMIRPTATVFWNQIKGGVDVYSRGMAYSTHSNASENPIVTVICRMISYQVHNACVVYRIQEA